MNEGCEMSPRPPRPCSINLTAENPMPNGVDKSAVQWFENRIGKIANLDIEDCLNRELQTRPCSKARE